MTVFDRLLSSGIPITFTTVGIAYLHRFKEPWYASTLIITEQVLAFALDQIGYVPPEQEERTAELAFAHPTDTWTIDRCLEGLISDAPQDIPHAMRLWRWVLLNDIITKFEGWDLNYSPETDPVYGAWLDDITGGVHYDLTDFWKCFPFPTGESALPEDWEDWIGDVPTTVRLIEEHRRWLGQEQEGLRAGVGSSTPLLPRAGGHLLCKSTGL